MRIATLAITVLCAVLYAPTLGAEEGKTPAHFGPDTGYTLDEAGLRKLAATLRDDPKVLGVMRPTYEDCRGIVKDQSEAIRLLDASHRVIEMLLQRLEIPASFTKVQIRAWPVLKEGDELPTVLGPLSEKGERFRKGARFWWIGLSEPDSPRGRSLPTFVASRGRWLFVADPATAIDDEKLTDDVFTLFLVALHQDDLDTVYALLSEHIRAQVTRKDLLQWIKRTGLGGVASVDWDKRGGARVVDRWFTERMGTVTFKGGRKMALRLYGAPEGDDLRIIYLALRTTFGIRPPSMFIPELEDCHALAKQTILRFIAAIGSGELAAVHAHAVEGLRKQLTPEVFAKAFAPHAARLEEYGFAEAGTVVWRHPPDIHTGDPFDNKEPMDPLRTKAPGALRLRGWLIAESKTTRVPFELQFKFVPKSGWLLSYANIGLPETASDK